ncbi:MAG: hypothetical protein ACLQUY_06870 [Ktedonobacterales bacterium]
MSDEQAIDLLEDANRALVGLEFIDDQFDLPAAMIGEDEVSRWSGSRIHQRRDQAMFDPVAGPLGIAQGVADEADHDVIASTAAAHAAGTKTDERVCAHAAQQPPTEPQVTANVPGQISLLGSHE